MQGMQGMLAVSGYTAVGFALGVAILVVVAALWMADVTIPGMQDVQLRLQAAVTKTATFNSTALDMGAAFAPGGGGLPVQGVVTVTALDTGDGNETYTFKLQESTDNSSFTDISPGVAVTDTGTVACKGFLSKRYVRLVATLAGTTPSVTYEAYLNRITL